MTSDEPDLRTLLIRAALEILEEPDTPLDLRKVAERAGKSRTAPYLVFGKEREGGGVVALRLAVAAEGAKMLLEELTPVLDSSDDPLEAFHQGATVFFLFATGRERLFRLMFGPEIGMAPTLTSLDYQFNPEFLRLVEARVELEELLHHVVRRCQEARLLPEGDILRQTMITWANLQGIALLLLDQVLETVGYHTTPQGAADLATEALVGTPRSVLEGATLCLLQAQERRAEEQKAQAAEAGGPEVAWMLDEMSASRQEERTEERYWALDERAPAGPTRRGFLANWRRHASEPPGDELAMPPGGGSLSAPEPEPPLPRDTVPNPALRRALGARTALRGARVLWIDDHPEWITWEKKMLERLEVEVTTATDTRRALERLQAEPYDLILSDIARGPRENEGVAALPALRSVAPDTPVVFYVGVLDERRGPPPGCAGITNRPDELLHLVLDVLERRRI